MNTAENAVRSWGGEWGNYPVFIHGGGGLGCLWFIGWLFTIGYLKLSFWHGVLAIIIWPYYLGKKFHRA
ncbi:hypothetical protein KW796_01345 [Candidatus Parcubacteria bacterium]|nr:hypothetical protein [Candidatus Parcubacteria bacterium]